MSESQVEVLTVEENQQLKTVTEKDRLKLAYWILGAASLFLFASSLVYSFQVSESSKEVFEKSWLVIPPVITLVIGFYFGNRR